MVRQSTRQRTAVAVATSLTVAVVGRRLVGARARTATSGAELAVVPTATLPAPTTPIPAWPPYPPVPQPPAGRLVPVLGLGRELALRGVVLLWCATTAWFWLWWLSAERGDWTVERGVASALIAFPTFLTAYFSFFACRMTKPDLSLAVPALRVAMVVTKAPSEPLELVQQTLVAALEQAGTYPYGYDVWLADERPDEETLRWCLEHGVAVSTRFGVTEYHQQGWPRRTRSKEGNLAWFYDTVGYDRYDVVVQLDADHRPAAGYLEAIVRPFADERVGYVAAPSVCDANIEAGWTVRGRLYREATLHGPVQSGCNGGWAPVCIGSHYAVRTAALRSIGGLGPELAEDFTTTLRLLADGWDGQFSIDAEAHGEGPPSVAEMIQQESQWARSLGTVLTRWAPASLRAMPWRARLRLTFVVAFYALLGAQFVAATVLPVVGVLGETIWVDVAVAEFYAHVLPPSLFAVLGVVILRRGGTLRPASARLWSWDLLLFQLLRWPFTTASFLRGAWTGLRADRPLPFRVTAKGGGTLASLPVRIVAPSLVLAVVPPWVALLGGDPGRARGVLLVVAAQALLYLAVACSVAGLHVRASGLADRASAVAVGVTLAAVPVCGVGLALCVARALAG